VVGSNYGASWKTKLIHIAEIDCRLAARSNKTEIPLY
jgi:hypothetical protein